MTEPVEQHPAHLFMLELGFAHHVIPAHWEDIGNGETGPMVRGHNGFHEYTGDDGLVVYLVDGRAEFEYVQEA